MVHVAVDYWLWVEVQGNPEATPLLLIMGANVSGLAWPESFVDRLIERHCVVRYDHRGTGRSTSAFDTHPYAVRDLAGLWCSCCCLCCLITRAGYAAPPCSPPVHWG
jgi:pimeloyl-ACP methyl ester carboxylesterase